MTSRSFHNGGNSVQNLSVILYSKDERLSSLFYQYFTSFINVAVTKDPFDLRESIDCFVVPSPSSYALPLGSIPQSCIQTFGSEFHNSVKQQIISDYLGELLPGEAIIVPTNNSNDCDQKKIVYTLQLQTSEEEESADQPQQPQQQGNLHVNYICWVSVARTPSRIPKDYAYNAMRGIFGAIMKHNKSNPKIVSVALSSLGLDSHSMEEQTIMVKQMALAYRSFYYPKTTLPTEEEAEMLDSQIYSTMFGKQTDRIEKITQELISENLAKRGLYDEEELSLLIGHLCGKDPELSKKACQCISILLHEKPSDFCLSREIICSGVVKSHLAVQTLLRETVDGNILLHTEIPLSDLNITDNIGDGTEATVFKANWGDIKVAVKKFRGIPARDQFIRELSIMSLCRHPNLIRCYGGQTTNEEACTIVTELMDSNLFDALSDQTLNLSFSKVLYIAMSVARGMEFLHSCNLIHRDLKSNNLLVKNINSPHCDIKICDFGLSRVVDKSKLMTGNVGTVSWIPPEIFEKKQYNEKCDVYSYGIILWELYYRKVPFSDISSFEIPIQVIEGKRPPLTKDIPKGYAKLMKLSWIGKSTKRPSFTQIIKILSKLQLLYPQTPSSPQETLRSRQIHFLTYGDRSHSVGSSLGKSSEKIGDLISTSAGSSRKGSRKNIIMPPLLRKSKKESDN